MWHISRQLLHASAGANETILPDDGFWKLVPRFFDVQSDIEVGNTVCGDSLKTLRTLKLEGNYRQRIAGGQSCCSS